MLQQVFGYRAGDEPGGRIWRRGGRVKIRSLLSFCLPASLAYLPLCHPYLEGPQRKPAGVGGCDNRKSREEERTWDLETEWGGGWAAARGLLESSG